MNALRRGTGLPHRILAVLAAAALMLGGCSGDSSPKEQAPSGLERYYAQEPSWRDCRDGFECATVEVPLDYAKPQGERLALSVIRLPARDRGERIGSLITNPGGPGSSGVQFLRDAGALFGERIRDRFDLIGFDPRGVGGSAPVRCLDGPRMDRFLGTDASPDDTREVEALRAEGRAFADACKARSGPRLPHVGTADAARDMDVLRAALGDGKLTYLGFSYGTYLGAVYAEQFPRKVRAMVLDGAVDPALSATDLLIEQAKGFETALRAFVEDCTAALDCPLGSDPEAALDKITDLQRQTDSAPLTSPRGDPRPINETWVTTGIAAALYTKASWPTLRQALAAAIYDNDGDLLLTLADQLYDRRPDGSYGNLMEANMAVNCVDKPNLPDVAAYQKEADKAARTAPRFGPYVVWSGLPCIYWPVQTTESPRPLSAKGSAPILVIGTTRDPATPYRWAQALSSQLASGVLLTFDGDGHTAYLGGSPCITQATDRYLLTTTPPADGTVCR
ncbi:alpha/beta hydrolase [Thermomonospora curvata]|uniref:TAP domain protein n=1 Tax=Thermomonospora curvata (strain ATCC 19995 / DSM 43183 / JCM 3096 / KCTC 9072 / NBRC 15933 / NCIMB 10081 / Henssen B9) TaxID=471852 RepID=D1A579_THECD|nr:alpha/beta hydrolase [Thermomonospora curvata]ACZ00065.1 TAP domain protein [Thermomonospora curvata DSM 43183]